MRNLFGIGENVLLTFNSTATSTVSSPMTLLDANMNPRTLQSFERLIIDVLEGTITTGTADIIAGSTSNASTLLGSMNTAVGLELTAKEGISLPVGVLPQVLPIGTGSTATIKVTGQGRIVEGTTQGVRPNWRESSNARGL